MRRVLYPFCIALLLLALAPGVSTADDAVLLQEARETADRWLDGIDRKQYGECWDQTSPLLQERMGRDSWIASLTQGEQALGGVEERTPTQGSLEHSPPNAPEGHYAMLVYTTDFARKKVEECLVLREEEGAWRVVGYWLR